MNQNVFTIFTGNTKTMNLKSLFAGTLDPLDLTSCTEIDVALPLAGGGFSHLLLSDDQVEISSPASLGKFTADIDAAASALLKIGELQNFEVTFTISGEITTVKFNNALSVFQGNIAPVVVEE